MSSRPCLTPLFLFFFLLPALSFSAPVLTIDQSEYDFGKVFQTEKVIHTFSFRNSGDEPLLIDRVKSSCGCTAALLSSRKLEPGEVGTIKATFDPSRFRGRVEKVIYLHANLPEEPPGRFVLKGIVTPVVEYSPQMLQFGSVREGEEKKLVLTLQNNGEKPLKIVNARANNAALSMATDAEMLAPGEAVAFTVFARPVKETIHLNGYLQVRTDNQSLSDLRIPMRGLVER